MGGQAGGDEREEIGGGKNALYKAAASGANSENIQFISRWTLHEARPLTGFVLFRSIFTQIQHIYGNYPVLFSSFSPNDHPNERMPTPKLKREAPAPGQPLKSQIPIAPLSAVPRRPPKRKKKLI